MLEILSVFTTLLPKSEISSSIAQLWSLKQQNDDTSGTANDDGSEDGFEDVEWDEVYDQAPKPWCDPTE